MQMKHGTEDELVRKPTRRRRMLSNSVAGCPNLKADPTAERGARSVVEDARQTDRKQMQLFSVWNDISRSIPDMLMMVGGSVTTLCMSP